LVNKKWLSFRGASPNLMVIEEKDDEWGSVTFKKSELIKSEEGDYYKISITYSMAGIWAQLKQRKDQQFMQIEIPDAGLMLDNPGSPQIPQEGLFVAIPDDAKDIEVSIVGSESKVHELDAELMPVPEPTRDTPKEIVKNEIYEKNEFYPGYLFKNLGPQKIGNVNTLHIMIYPVQYNPKANKIEVYSKIQLEIKYRKPKPKFRGGFRSTPSKKKRVPKMFKDNLLNLENV